MSGYIKRNIKWIVCLAALLAVCAASALLMLHQKSQYSASLSALEAENTELSSLAEQQEARINELTITVNNLNQENAALSEVINNDSIQNEHDVFAYERSLPPDLIDTVLTYYQSKADGDLETFKSVIIPVDGERRSYMLGTFEYPANPNQGDGIHNVMLVDTSADDVGSIKDKAFEGSVALMINMGLGNGEYLYLVRENGKWYVSDYD
jgi:hypothetical protein